MIRSSRPQRIIFIIAAALMAASISACNVNINVNGSPIEQEDGANSDESREPVIAEGLPEFSVEGNSDLPGNFFLSFVYTRNLIMLDGKGNIVWSKHEEQPEEGLHTGLWDFKKHVIDGKTYYSYHDQIASYDGYGLEGYAPGERVIMDENFNEIKRITFEESDVVKKGDPLDGHDFLMIGPDHYILSGYIKDTVYNHPDHPDGSSVVYSYLQEVKDGSVVWEFKSIDYPELPIKQAVKTEITVSKDRSYQAAMRLVKENPGCKIAVLNFADAFHAGGGVTKGSSAQEECLCRTSTLYPLLYRKTLRDSFYAHHIAMNTPKASDSLVYTEGVVICKTDEDLPKRMPKDDWVTVDVITMAAPDLRDKSNMHAALVGNGTYMNNAELFGYHVKRAMHMLTVTAHKEVDILVLGAFGCGAFQNDPEVVARAYRTALDEFPKVFKKIEFAVYCPAVDTTNYSVFKRIFDES